MTPITSLFLVQFPKGTKVCQVDDFPPGTARSCEGSMHIMPSSTKSITAQEMAHLQSKGIKMQKLGKTAPPPAPSAAPASAPASSKPKSRRHADAPALPEAKEASRSEQ